MTADAPAVAFDFSTARFNLAGTGSYSRWLAAGLRVLMGERLQCIQFPFAEGRATTVGWRRSLWALQHVAWTQVGVIRAARRVEADLLHVPSVLAPTRSSMPLVVTIHDLSVLRFPAQFPRGFRTWVRLTLPHIVRRAAVVLTDSSASRDDLLERWPALSDRVVVVPLGIPPRKASWEDPKRLSRLHAQYGLDRPFVLTVGSLEPRKNLDRLLRAIRELRADVATRDVMLIHAGPPGWLTAELQDLIRELGLTDAVKFLGYVPEEDLTGLYRLARVMAYPSLFEGFGLPILEAMASKCPVLTSNVSSMPEVAGNAALLVDPTSVDAIAAGIGRLWLDASLRRRLESAGLERAARFTVERMAHDTLAAYRRVRPG